MYGDIKTCQTPYAEMLSVSRAIMTACDFILLDEPSMGLSPPLMYDMFRVLKTLSEEGMTILLSQLPLLNQRFRRGLLGEKLNRMPTLP
jgi:ABC-type branched-subunit amino acid transport system ATPase component